MVASVGPFSLPTSNELSHSGLHPRLSKTQIRPLFGIPFECFVMLALLVACDPEFPPKFSGPVVLLRCPLIKDKNWAMMSDIRPGLRWPREEDVSSKGRRMAFCQICHWYNDLV